MPNSLSIQCVKHSPAAAPLYSRILLLTSDVQQSVLGELDQRRPNPFVYSPHGLQSGVSQAATHLGFNGQLKEQSTGWYHLGNGYRVYNPLLMRFHSPDSWSPFGEGGLNAYAYCLGDPVNMTDFTGHTPTLVKYIFRTLGIMNVPRIKSSAPKPAGIMKVRHSTPSEQQSSDLMKNMTNNLDNEYRAKYLTEKRYNELFRLNKVRNLNYSELLADPKHRATTGAYTQLPSGERIPTRDNYIKLTLKQHENSTYTPPPERASRLNLAPPGSEKIRFIPQVPEPIGGFKTVADAKAQLRASAEARRNKIRHSK